MAIINHPRKEKILADVISGVRPDVDDICALVEYHAA
jgi:hypothetical protein